MAAQETGPGRRAPLSRSAAQTREHVLEVAERSFYTDGIHATGIDAIASRAGVAPATLYRLFASKDDLVAAYVERCRERYQALLERVTARETDAPRERILGVFDAFADDVASGSCRGCPFLMVLAEYPDPRSRAHANAVAHKAWLRDLFHRLVAELGSTTPIQDPEALGDHLALLAEGMYGSVQALGPGGPAAHGRSSAETLLDAASRVPCPR